MIVGMLAIHSLWLIIVYVNDVRKVLIIKTVRHVAIAEMANLIVQGAMFVCQAIVHVRKGNSRYMGVTYRYKTIIYRSWVSGLCGGINFIKSDIDIPVALRTFARLYVDGQRG